MDIPENVVAHELRQQQSRDRLPANQRGGKDTNAVRKEQQAGVFRDCGDHGVLKRGDNGPDQEVGEEVQTEDHEGHRDQISNLSGSYPFHQARLEVETVIVKASREPKMIMELESCIRMGGDRLS